MPFDVIVGRIAERAHMLPSDAWDRATSYDWQNNLMLQQIDNHNEAKSSG